jgi:hypothetical protein
MATGERLHLEISPHPSAPVGRFQELENRFRYLVVLNVAAAQFVRDVHGHVTRPALGGVEGDDPDRIFILPVEAEGGSS